MFNYLPYLRKEKFFLEGFKDSLFVFLIALVTVLLFVPFVRRFAILRGAIDHPRADERRIHREPIPRWGGIAIYASIVVSILFWYLFFDSLTAIPSYLVSILICSGFITLVGAWDDIKPLNASFQSIFLIFMGLLVQFLSGIDYPLQIKNIEWLFFNTQNQKLTLTTFCWPITAIYIFIATKTMDTIDGVDGLSAGLAVIGASLLLILGICLNKTQIALIPAAVIGSGIGFLVYNFNPAIIFMGTGGAQILGFMLASVSVMGFLQNIKGIFLFLPLIIFAIPFFDAFFVIVKRLIAKQPISQADKRHIHHTLMGCGLNQRQTVFILYMIALSLCSIYLHFFMNGEYLDAKA